MKNFYTIPATEYIDEVVKRTPSYMQPNISPNAIVGEGLLTDEQCDTIILEMSKLDSYNFTNCNAVTRECPRPLSSVLDPIVEFTRMVNEAAWEFVIDECGAWFQTYTSGMDYQIHTDATIGQTRKLTTVALLSDPSSYEGGLLRVIPYPAYEAIPRTRGTLVTFPGWMLHEVTPVHSGLRQTINLGIWGPPWR